MRRNNNAKEHVKLYKSKKIGLLQQSLQQP